VDAELKETVEKVKKVVLASLKPLGQDYGFFVERVKAEGQSPDAKIVVRNQHTFLEITWSLEEGFWYELGPLVHHRIPFRATGPQTVPLHPNRYEIAWFSRLVKQPIPRVRAKSDLFPKPFRMRLSS
jgi:hypothetical protein